MVIKGTILNSICLNAVTTLSGTHEKSIIFS